jgi:DNA replication protein DnaD
MTLTPIAKILKKRFEDGVKTLADVESFLNANLITQEDYNIITGVLNE